MWPPISTACWLWPGSVAQKLPAASRCVSTGKPVNRSVSHWRAAVQTGVKATRWAPFSSPVSRRSSASSRTVRAGSSVGMMALR